MKKISLILLTAILVVALASCGDNGCTNHVDSDFNDICDTCGEAYVPACGGHWDENADFSCDKCNEPYAPICMDHKDTNANFVCDKCGVPIAANYTVTLVTVDDEGVAVSGLVLVLENEYNELFYVTSNSDGIATTTLEAGQYHVTYREDTVPEGYICIPKSISLVSDGMRVELEIINNIPNGTAKRPYVVTDEVNTLSLPANETYYYIISHAADRTLIVTGEGFKIIYNEETYEPVEGEIRIKLVEKDTNDPSIFAVVNESGEQLDAPIVLEAPVGSQNNPIVITSLEQIISANVVADVNVYYKWVASFTGTLVITSESENKDIKITNGTNSIQAEIGPESNAGAIEVTEGDEISVVVSVSVDGTVEFILLEGKEG